MWMQPCFCTRRRIAGPDTMATTPGNAIASLTQITPQNVANLSLAWAFQTNQPAEIKSTPILVDGVLYFTVPDNVWAIDARSGHMLWHYTYPPNKGDHIGQRGVAMYKDWIFFVSPDAHLVSLNAKDGKVRWIIELADVEKGYWATEAPFIVGNHVIVGVGGDLDNIPMFLKSVDPETGQTQWQWNVTPPPGPGVTTGGTTWMAGTYDPDPQPHLLGNRESHAGVGRQRAAGRRPLHLQHRGSESRYRQAGVGLSAFAA